MNEFESIEQVLRGYRPVGPSPTARARFDAMLQAAQRQAGSVRRAWRWLTIAAAAAAIVIAILLGRAAWWRPFEPSPPATSSAANADAAPIPEAFARAWTTQPRIAIPGVSSAARVVVVAFMDWPCPGCVTVYPRLRDIADRYGQRMPGAVEVVVLDWPWNADCNPHLAADSPLRHEAACVAAAAVRIARSRGKGDEMIDWVVANRPLLEGPDWKERILSELRRLLPGLDFEREYRAVLPAITADTDRGAAVGVNVTPDVYVNGVRLQGSVGTPEAIDWAVRLELGKGN